LNEITTSALPSLTNLDLSVVVTESGVAEVPLSRDVLQASPDELSRAVDQLAWTLRQVPGIDRVRITVGGAPVPLTSGQLDAPVTSGPQYDASGNAQARLLGLRGGRVVDLLSNAPSSATTVEGPLGRPGYSMRSLAASASPSRIAAVSGNGTTVFVAGTGSTSLPVTRPVVKGTDVLRPSYDMFGDLWLLDRTRKGARVVVVSGNQVRRLNVPGVTGADVAAFSVAHDGSRLAVAYGGAPVRVTDILRTDEGLVSGAGRSQLLSPGVADDARIVDIGWRDPATLAVLSRPTAETSQVGFIAADGSPVNPALAQPSIFRGAAQAMVVAPDTSLPLLLITPDQRLYTLSDNGNWPRTSSKVAGATYGP
jgi:hypothetical protein